MRTPNGQGMESLLIWSLSTRLLSGTKLHRQGLDEMLAAAKARRFSVLYLYSLSRLARESVITMPMLKTLVHIYRVRVISVSEGIDSAQDGWDLLATLLSVTHERFIKDLSANVLRGQEGTVLDGFSVGDYCFGFSSEAIPGSEGVRRGRHAKPRMRYTIDPGTSCWVIRIFEWFVVENRSLQWITRELNRLDAPKDHRATTKGWHHTYVSRLLANKKYALGNGLGEKSRNVRNPLILARFRRKIERKKKPKGWTQQLSCKLRIVTDGNDGQGPGTAEKNASKLANCRRRSNGRLNGSNLGNAAAHPRHSISGLIRCAGCQARFRVGGANGRYLTCPNRMVGSCTCKTQLRRDLAERKILEVIVQRILMNPKWRDVVYQEGAATAYWREQGKNTPTELENIERALKETERKIANLLDGLENGIDLPDISGRLKERRTEQAALLREAERLAHAGSINRYLSRRKLG